ncbi:MAG TPA: Re/Si-specific NAD(P)(+) transhydrogenase subunit alpha [Phycisphaerales bacterium]|nr:Re/Si-specific NAD(P)(+) transhydrogenase subunit alpha [Phycisphaerales bacterium]
MASPSPSDAVPGPALRVAIPREVHPGERRVAATPQTVMKLCQRGHKVSVQSGLGADIAFSDAAYAEAGAEVIEDVRALWAGAEVVLKVRPPEEHPGLAVHEASLLPEGACLISFMWPAQNRAALDRLNERKATVLAMDCVPRITRAQSMDALSAMANLAGYRAVIEAANHFPRFFSGQITAAGKIAPAKVLVIGAGVAGLASIGAARALGAIVRAFDPRPATKDQVRSMGAEFLEVGVHESGEGAGGYAKVMSDAFIQAEMALFAAQAMEVDIIVTTALIPGKPAPKLITAGMVESMGPGSVIVDLAAEQGGNCALTVPGQVVTHKGVTIIGYTDLPSRMATQASQLYAATVATLLAEACKDGRLHIDELNTVIRGAMVCHRGAVTWPPPPAPVPVAPPPPEPGVAPETQKPATPAPHAKGAAAHGKPASGDAGMLWLAAAGALLILLGLVVPPGFLSHFTVFVLACFVGWQVVWNVKPALHTPLMSVTNAISGIILVGGMLQLAGRTLSATIILGAVAVFIASINIAGGFLVTQRMLAMFRR